MPWSIDDFWWKFRFSWFHIFKGISHELIWIFSCWYVSHNTCSLTLLVYSWFAFMRLWYGIYGFECLVPCDLHVFHEKQFCFHFLLLKNSVLVFKIFTTSSCSSHLVEIFKQITLSNLFLKTPTINGRLDGRPWSSMFHLENHLKLILDGW